MSLSPTGKVASILGSVFLLLLLIAATAIVGTHDAAQIGRRAARSHEVRAELAAALAGITQAEAGARASFATGDGSYLSDYRDGLARAEGALARARALTADQPTLRQRLDTVSILLADRRAIQEEPAGVATSSAAAGGDRARRMARGMTLTARIAASLDSLDAAERRILAESEAVDARDARRTRLLITLLSLLTLLLGTLAARYFRSDLIGRRRAEEALRDSEQRFHAIFDQTFQLTALLTPQGRVVEMNETALVFVELPLAQVVGRALPDFPWWGAAERDLIREAIAGAARGSFVRCEAQIHGPGGRTVSLDLSFKPMRDEAGQLTMLIAEGRDITQRLTAEAALRASEARFAGILALAADAIITVDEEQRILHFNRRAEEIFGYTAEEMMGQPLELLLPPRLRGSHRGAVATFGASGSGHRTMGRHREITGLRRDGTEFPVEGSISTLETAHELLHTVVMRDVTELRQAERRQAFLADAGDKLAATLEYEPTLEQVVRLAVPVLGELCVLDLDVDAGTDGSRATVAHVDPELEEVMRNMRQRYPPPWDGPHPVARARRTGGPMLLEAHDGELITSATVDDEHRAMLARLEVRSALFVPLTVRGRVLGVLSSYCSSRSLGEDDLALAQELARRAAMAIDNARSYRASRHASLARDEVLGVVSHDLRNPLSAIIMCGEALTTEQDPAELAHVGDVIRSSARWMQHIIRDLLDVTAIEAGRLSVSLEQTSAPAIVEALAVMHGGAARERSITLHSWIAGDLAQLEADPDRVIQAVGNLLGNAIRFTPSGGRVWLEVVPYEECGVAFRVRDTGPGISPSQLPHIFDRFWQATQTRRGGVGLGLAIAKGIAEAHGGRVEVDSAPGGGSTFTLVLPRALANQRGEEARLDEQQRDEQQGHEQQGDEQQGDEQQGDEQQRDEQRRDERRRGDPWADDGPGLGA